MYRVCDAVRLGFGALACAPPVSALPALSPPVQAAPSPVQVETCNWDTVPLATRGRPWPQAPQALPRPQACVLTCRARRTISRRRRRVRARRRIRRQQLLPRLRAAMGRIARPRRGEEQMVRALSTAMWYHRSAPQPQKCGEDMRTAAIPSPLRRALGRVWAAVRRGCLWVMRALAPLRARGFDVRSWIAWVSGEAYIPGPRAQRGSRPPRHHVADLMLRFHNVRGLADGGFRAYYLAQARHACDILVLAETGCRSEKEEREWAKDWRGSGGNFWASGPRREATEKGHSARGMAVFISKDAEVQKARVVAQDPGGRFIAVAMEVSGFPLVLVGCHAEKDVGEPHGGDADAQQEAFYTRVKRQVPRLPGHEYIFAMDTNNVADEELDQWSLDRASQGSQRPRAISAMQDMLWHFGAASDAFRSLYEHRREYTRVTPDNGQPRSKRRIDRLYVPRRLVSGAAVPRVKEVRHVRPGTRDLEAVRRLGCTRKWSDHAAVQMCLQCSGLPRAKSQWTLPLHTVREPRFVSGLMWPIRNAWLARQDLPAQARLDGMMAEIKEKVCAKVKAESKAHHAEKSRLLRRIAKCDAAPSGVGGMGKGVNEQREAAVNALFQLHQAEQRRWLHDRGYEKSLREDTCWKGFFEETRDQGVRSHIESLSGPTRRHKDMPGMFKEASRYFGAPGNIFNLQRREKASVRERRRIDEAQESMMEALQKDGKRVPLDMYELLSSEKLLSDWNVQKAIESLASGKAPGPDGWPAEFFKRMSPRLRDEDGTEHPSGMACLIAQVLRDCMAGGEMTTDMKHSVTSLIWKGKGPRCSLKSYRPITCTAVLYKILGRCMVQSMRPVLPYLVAEGQAAFQGDPKFIGDATRLVQDVIAYCDSEHQNGFLLFCDQDSAYPRVEWEYLRAILETMHIHKDFISLVDMMHVGIEGHFKINGHVGGRVRFGNALLQGDPVAPILYLLYIQSLISLIDTSGLRGIEIPGALGDLDRPATPRAVGFADDLLVFLRHPAELTGFKRLFDMYALASGAVLSLPKSYGMRIGRLRHSRYDLPPGWKAGRDIQFTDDPVRYLGIFLGAPKAVREVWDARVTGKMEQRWARWRAQAMPRTRGGRNIVVRNSVLSCGWYMVEHQWIPSLDQVLEGWRKEAWGFFEGAVFAGARGRAAVPRAVLVQDYHEMGVRAQDVESFVDALRVRWVRRLVDPAPHPYKGLVFYWIHRAYGHLRQGQRLLVSTCDFLCLGEGVPPFWSAVLRALGARRGLVPAVDQGEACPEVTYAQAREGMLRSVNVMRDATLAEVLMEPLWYNPSMQGWLGAAVVDRQGYEVHARKQSPAVAPLRSSRERERQACEYYNLTLAFAGVGLTHVADLLVGTGPNEALDLRPLDPSWPQAVTVVYPELLRALPLSWLRAIRVARGLRAASPGLPWRVVVRSAPRPRCVWMTGPGGLIARVEPNGCISSEWYIADPLGRLRATQARPDAQVWLQATRQVVVWKQEVPPRCEEEATSREEQERKEDGGGGALPVYVMGGAVEDRYILRYDQSVGRPGSRAATDLSRFVWQHGSTDRRRPSVGVHMADTHSLYDLRMSRLFVPLRTFELNAAPSPEHTVWIDVLKGDERVVSRTELSRRRGLVFGAQHLTGHDRVAKDLGYSVLSDAWPVGNGRCGKRGGPTHTLCDVCYRVLGRSTRETTRHIVLDCPQARLFLDLLWRARVEATSQDFNVVRETRRSSPDSLVRRAACALVTACAPPSMDSSEPLMTLVRAAQSELYRARCVNAALARTGIIYFDVKGMYRAVRAKVLSEGQSRRRTAEDWEAELALRYPGWVPGEDGPVKKWERAWLSSGYLKEIDGHLACGLLADPMAVPGSALRVADLRVKATSQLSRSTEGVLVRLGLRLVAVADCSPPDKVQARVAARPGGVELSLEVCEAEERRRRRIGPVVTELPSCVIYTDGGYEGAGVGSERAGWGWVAVQGGDGIGDEGAWEVARACGQVELDPASLAHLGALKLSNNTAEGQGLAEALLWLARSSVPQGALVLLRPDSDLVMGWATGRTAAHANLELVSSLRAIYTQVAACWRLRWARVKGHSGHLWNDEADALATRGCQGEVLGFSCGQPVAPAVPPPL